MTTRRQPMTRLWVSVLSLVFLSFFACKSQAWIQPTTFLAKKSYATRLYDSPFEIFDKPKSNIPAELKDEIYAAEANTPAAKERGQRVALYIFIAFFGVVCAFFNAFLSELRSPGPDGTPGADLVEAGFGWAQSNFLVRFIFLNRIGGAISLLGGAGAAMFVEFEMATKDMNAEKIYEELVRRREAKMKKQQKRQGKPSTAGSGKKGRRSGKEKKRLEALSEVVRVEESQSEPTSEIPVTEQTTTEDARKVEEKKESDGGIFGKVKELYEKADTMAASQALIMNKKLEDAGLIEKITDETGLKVIGREEAAKLQEKKKQEQQD